MPMIISLAAYLVRIRDLNEREDEVLSEIEGDRDLLDYLYEQLGIMKEMKHNKEHQQVLTVTKLGKSGRRLSGLIETGEYGRETNIYSVPEQKIVYRRKTQDADLWPFYFMVDIPEGTDDGLLILQRTGNFGIRKVVHRFLSESFLIDFGDMRLRLEPIIDPEQLARFERGLIQEVRFVKISLPSDPADAYEGGHQETFGKMELVIKARRGSALPERFREQVAKLLKQRERSGVFAIDSGKFEYNDIKLRTQVGRTTKLFSIGDPKLRSYYEVTDQVTIGPGGHPTFASISKVAEDLADRLLKKMYLQGPR